MPLSFKLTVFEGPLDLLLHLIEKNKVDIYDIPIVSITEQYMDYVREIKKEDLGVMSEFLVMAATLLDIKCRMLLPREVNEEGEEQDPRDDLVQRLLEYKTYKYMSGKLRDMMEEAGGSFFRKEQLPKEVLAYKVPVDPRELLDGVTLQKLHAVFEMVMRRQENKLDPIRSRFGKIEREPLSVSDKMLQIRDYAKEHRRFSFRRLLTGQKDKFETIVTFLSVLELVKMGHMRVEQADLFDDLHLEITDNPEEWSNLTEYAEEEQS